MQTGNNTRVPQLPAEMESKFNEEFQERDVSIDYTGMVVYFDDRLVDKNDIKTFFATALEKEREKVLSEVWGEIVKMWKPFGKATDCAAYHIHNDLLNKVISKLNQLKGSDVR